MRTTRDYFWRGSTPVRQDNGMPNHRITHNLEQGGWEDDVKPNHFFLNGNFDMVPGVRNFIPRSAHTFRDHEWHLASRLGEYTPNNP